MVVFCVSSVAGVVVLNYRSQGQEKQGRLLCIKNIYKVSSLARENSSLFSVYFIENYCIKVIRIDWQEHCKGSSPTN
jgi:hypothetical protein